MLKVVSSANRIGKEIMQEAGETEQMITNLLASVQMEFDGELKKKTPIDTGNARRSWFFNPPKSEEQEVENYNTAPYIRHLDHGSSQQAPNGMTAEVMAKSDRIIERAIKNTGL